MVGHKSCLVLAEHSNVAQSWGETGLGTEGWCKHGAFSHSELDPHPTSSQPAARDTSLFVLTDGKLSLGR